MQKIILIALFLGVQVLTNAQNLEGANKEIEAGIKLYDSGNFNGAIKCYDKALKLDKDNPYALYEKMLTFNALQKYKKALEIGKQILLLKGNDNLIAQTYVTMGNVYDQMKEPEEAFKIYNEGIKRFPDEYMLYFNKGIALYGMNELAASQQALEKAVQLNPDHAGSLNALGSLLYTNGEPMPALLVLLRFLSVEPNTQRSIKNLALVKKIIKSNVKKGDKNSIIVNFDAKKMLDTTANGKKNANNFTGLELLLSMQAAIDLSADKKINTDTEVKRFEKGLKTVCSYLAENKSKNSGFYWEFFAPYFIELQEYKELEVFSYFSHVTFEDKEIGKWLKSHAKELEIFLKWSESFGWEKIK